jgi:hypothetical protein
MFSASAGVLTRVFTTIDAFRSIIEWSDSWPRDYAGRRLEHQRISSPPLTVPTPVGGPRPNPSNYSPQPRTAYTPPSDKKRVFTDITDPDIMDSF